MKPEKPIAWVANARARSGLPAVSAAELFPPDLPRRIRRFHRQIPAYRTSPLIGRLLWLATQTLSFVMAAV